MLLEWISLCRYVEEARGGRWARVLLCRGFVARRAVPVLPAESDAHMQEFRSDGGIYDLSDDDSVRMAQTERTACSQT